ncbi:hypothetical protein [Mycolicibacterium sp. CBMA 234]|uniref:hypothetical protein n=1 Tax=Mycolicibacterium sp. CBMA 234 TaxID=1918495 RepID=UPI00192E70BC|nr:hypothetical protein [Mycolicibacterium sp. CBMA 234]
MTPHRLIEDGTKADAHGCAVTALWTPRHSPGHLCFLLHDAAVILTGDHVLPGITPNMAAAGVRA